MPATDKDTANPRPDVAELARLISVHAPYDGVFPLRVPGVDALRRSRTASEVAYALQHASVCIVAQGEKNVGIGDTTYHYGAGQIAVFSIDVPVTAQLTRASHAEPYLTLRIALDPEKVATFAAKVYPHGLPRVSESRAVYIGEADASIVDVANRLLRLMAQPVDVELLAPLAIDEIFIRLLRSPMGARIAQIGQEESSLQKMAKRCRGCAPTTTSPSFHRQFKAVTSMSPQRLREQHVGSNDASA